MGREIRKVPPNWQHPMTTDSLGRPQKKAMYDQRFEDAAREWKEGLAAWERGERPSYFDATDRADIEYWEYHSDPPDREYYRQWRDEEATWFQLWETVSEGTPVSPPFATREELADYLAENGDEWDQLRRRESDGLSRKYGLPCDPWGKERAYAFVMGMGWEPSMVIENGRILERGELAARKA